MKYVLNFSWCSYQGPVGTETYLGEGQLCAPISATPPPQPNE